MSSFRCGPKVKHCNLATLVLHLSSSLEMAVPGPSSHSLLESTLGPWESTLGPWESSLKDVSNSGYASSEETLMTYNVAIYPDNGRVVYREHNRETIPIQRLDDIPSKSMHFQAATRARFADANSLETARVVALTMAITSGSIKITGPYGCVNHMGTYPNDAAPALYAETPVPIKIQHSQVVPAIPGCHEVTVARNKRKKIYVCHMKAQYAPNDTVQRLKPHRIYFAGVMPPTTDPREVARKHYNDNLSQKHLGASLEVKTEKVAVTVLGLTGGLITMLYSDYMDGLQLKYSYPTVHSINTLTPIYLKPGEQVNLPVMWESDSDGRHITIFSTEQVKVMWQHDTTVWLSDRLFAWDGCLDGDKIQKAARQFKNLSLESYAALINASTLDIVATYQRRARSVERSICGDAGYLFQGDGRLAKDSIRASPLRREQLEGVALLATPHGDYSLRTSAKVMYTRGENGVWHIDPKGDTASVPGSELVGAQTVCR